MTTWMPLLWTTYYFEGRIESTAENKKNSEQVGPMNESAANNGEKKIDQEIDPFRCRAQ